jgi:ribonuclease HI
MTICICSDSKAALLALSSYTISSKLLYQCWLSLQDLSNYNRVRLFWVPGQCDIKGNKEADRLQEWARTPISVDRSLLFHCQLQLSGI